MGINFDFPNAPATGDVYAPAGGPIWRWNGFAWEVAASSSGPTGPVLEAPFDHRTYGRKDAAWTPILSATVTPYAFGGAGDGVTDDTIAINAAISYLFTNSRGGTVDMSGGRWLVDSADIQLKTGVSLVGSWNNAGNDESATPPTMPPNHFEQFKSSIILNPLYTIQMAPGDSCGVKGLVLIRKGLTFIPFSTPRAGVDAVNAFAGKAVTVGDGTISGNSARDTYFGHCFVVGFAYAYWASGADRMHIEHIQGDCTNGIYISKCYDMQHLSHCHFWPYVTSNAGSAVNNGSGLIRLTTNATVLVTGDIVTVYNVGGVPNATGRWTVTVIDSTHIDLQGSTFAGAFTSGGSVYFDTYRRTGSAYWFDDDVDWGQADNCFAFGWDIGFNMYSGNHGELLNCGTDNNASSHDPGAIGFRIMDCHAIKLIGCKAAAAAIGVLVDTQPTNITTLIGMDCWGIQDTCIKTLGGYTVISGAVLNGANGIVVDPNSAGVCVSGCYNDAINAAKIITITGNALRKSTIVGNAWSDAGSVAERRINTYGNTSYFWDYYHDSGASTAFIGRKARGSVNAPAAALSSDSAISLNGALWDGVDTFRTIAGYRFQANANVTPTSSPGKHVWGITPIGSVIAADRLVMDETQLFSAPHKSMNFGASTSYWSTVFTQTISLRDNADVGTITASAGRAQIYIDPADGDLKIMFGDGVVKTIVVDT
jgi:hypothetical protein